MKLETLKLREKCNVCLDYAELMVYAQNVQILPSKVSINHFESKKKKFKNAFFH